ncbi:MAG: hypothetical protein AAFV95_15160 [Bacteroidota bacterium]
MEQFNRVFYLVVFWMMTAILVLIPLGFLMQFRRNVEFVRDYPEEVICGNLMGILFMALIYGECYLLLIFTWLYALRRNQQRGFLQLIQLILIALLGLIPGLFLAYAALFKN